MVPAFTALVIGFQASFSEEAMFRLFAINLFKKYGVPTALAVFFSAAMWGFGHTGYEIFPMWFRGVEVTCIGIIMGIFYLRFGLVTVIAAHFLIDAFLSNLPYLLKPHASFDFYTALAVVVLPLFLALIAFIFNRNTQEKPLSLRFNAQQQFNYNLLEELCRSKTPEELIALKKDLAATAGTRRLSSVFSKGLSASDKRPGIHQNFIISLFKPYILFVKLNHPFDHNN